MKHLRHLFTCLLLILITLPVFTQTVWTSVDNVRLREEPNKDSETIVHIPEETQLEFLQAVSSEKEQISLRGTKYNDLWIKVLYIEEPDGEEMELYHQGWIYGGAVKFYSQTQKNAYNHVIFPVVDFLSIREAPNTSSAKIGTLREGQPVYFQHTVSPYTENMTLRGVNYDEPWAKIKVGDTEGWVYAGAMRAWREKNLEEYAQGGQLSAFFPASKFEQDGDVFDSKYPDFWLQTNDVALFEKDADFSWEMDMGQEQFTVVQVWNSSPTIQALRVVNDHPAACVATASDYLLTIGEEGLLHSLYLYESGYYEEECYAEGQSFNHISKSTFEVDEWVMDNCDNLASGEVKKYRIEANGKVKLYSEEVYEQKKTFD